METKEFMEKPVKSLFFRYLIPSIMGTMVTSIYVLADTIIIGKGLGSVAMAALNIALPIYNIYFGLGLLFGVGGSVLMSIYRGRGEKEKADAYFTSAFLMNTVVWLLLLAASIFFMEDLAWLLGGTEETMPYIMDYIPYIIGGMGAFFFSSFLQTFVRNDGAPNLAMNAVIIGGVTNIILDYVFVFRMNLGLTGAALATVIAQGVVAAFNLSYLFRNYRNVFTWDGLKISFSRLKAMVRIGISPFGQTLIPSVIIVFTNWQCIRYGGDDALAVFSLLSYVLSCCFKVSAMESSRCSASTMVQANVTKSIIFSKKESSVLF